MKASEPAKVTGDCAAAKEALTDMPPRLESELDPVTLHNQAIMFADEDPTGNFIHKYMEISIFQFIFPIIA